MEQNKTFVELEDGSIVEQTAETNEIIVASMTRLLPEPTRTQIADELLERLSSKPEV